MELSAAERLILANQYRILQRLETKPRNDYERSIEILENGYTEYYGFVVQYLEIDPFPVSIATEVHDILAMFAQLQWVKDSLYDPTLTESPLYQFWGFDGNNSSRHLEYAQFLHKMREFKDLDDLLLLNSHSDNIETYRAMVAAWKSLPEGRWGLQMTTEDVRSILNAAIERRRP